MHCSKNFKAFEAFRNCSTRYPLFFRRHTSGSRKRPAAEARGIVHISDDNFGICSSHSHEDHEAKKWGESGESEVYRDLLRDFVIRGAEQILDDL